MAFKIGHLHIKTRDTQKTSQWFVDVLGAKVVRETPTAGGSTNFRLDLHGVPLNVSEFVDRWAYDQKYGLEHIALETDDMTGLMERIKSSGAKVLQDGQSPDGRKVAFVEGPEGIYLELAEMHS